MSIRSRPPTRGSDSMPRHRAGRVHIQSAKASGSSHSSYTTSGGAGSRRRTSAAVAGGSVTAVLLPGKLLPGKLLPGNLLPGNLLPGKLLPGKAGGERVDAPRPECSLLADPVLGGGQPFGAQR